MNDDQDYKGMCELPLSDSGLFGFTLPDMSHNGGALEVMRVIETWDDRPPVYVLLRNVKDFAETWGKTLADVAWAIVRDYYESSPEELDALRTCFNSALDKLQKQ